VVLDRVSLIEVGCWSSSSDPLFKAVFVSFSSDVSEATMQFGEVTFVKAVFNTKARRRARDLGQEQIAPPTAGRSHTALVLRGSGCGCPTDHSCVLPVKAR
jgi:hypothetical protein